MTRSEIHLWFDRTTDSEDPRWIVSRDDDQASETLESFAADDRESALARAEDEAKRHHLPLILIGTYGQRTPLN